MSVYIFQTNGWITQTTTRNSGGGTYLAMLAPVDACWLWTSAIGRVISLLFSLAPSEREEAIKKCAIALEGLTEIFSVYVFTAIPLLFQLFALRGELLGNTFYDVGDEAIRLFDSLTRLIDERGLYLTPSCAEVLQFVLGK